MNRVLSAIAPDTIVAAVAQNTRLKTKLEAFSATNFEKSVNNPIVGTPINPPAASCPTSREKPSSINTTVPIQKSIKFFIIMLPAFLARVKPVSTIAKPHCIKNTRAAPIKNQIPKA